VPVISLLRSAVARSRQRPIGALAILTVIVGVVITHSMSGSPTSHSHYWPHDDAVVAMQPAGGQGATSAQVTAAEPGTGTCDDGCGGHDLAMAMCLMILVASLALVVPARWLVWRDPLEWSLILMPVPAGARAVATPSWQELCVSRR